MLFVPVRTAAWTEQSGWTHWSSPCRVSLVQDLVQAFFAQAKQWCLRHAQSTTHNHSKACMFHLESVWSDMMWKVKFIIKTVLCFVKSWQEISNSCLTKPTEGLNSVAPNVNKQLLSWADSPHLRTESPMVQVLVIWLFSCGITVAVMAVGGGLSSSFHESSPQSSSESQVLGRIGMSLAIAPLMKRLTSHNRSAITGSRAYNPSRDTRQFLKYFPAKHKVKRRWDRQQKLYQFWTTRFNTGTSKFSFWAFIFQNPDNFPPERNGSLACDVCHFLWYCTVHHWLAGSVAAGEQWPVFIKSSSQVIHFKRVFVPELSNWPTSQSVTRNNFLTKPQQSQRSGMLGHTRADNFSTSLSWLDLDAPSWLSHHYLQKTTKWTTHWRPPITRSIVMHRKLVRSFFLKMQPSGKFYFWFEWRYQLGLKALRETSVPTKISRNLKFGGEVLFCQTFVSGQNFTSREPKRPQYFSDGHAHPEL